MKLNYDAIELILYRTGLRFIAGLGIGPLALAPLSEFYGRTPIYLFGYLIFFAFGFLPAFGNFPGLLAGRFIQGVSGSAFLSVAGGSVTDLWVGNEIGRVSLWDIAASLFFFFLFHL